MGRPRKKWPQFTLADKKLPLGPINELFRTVEGLDGLHYPEGYRNREFGAPAAPPHPPDLGLPTTPTVSTGVRTLCEVVHCSCGKNFKGEVKEEVKLKPRQ